MKLKDTCSLEEKFDQLRQHIKNRGIILPTKVHLDKEGALQLSQW